MFNDLFEQSKCEKEEYEPDYSSAPRPPPPPPGSGMNAFRNDNDGDLDLPNMTMNSSKSTPLRQPERADKDILRKMDDFNVGLSCNVL